MSMKEHKTVGTGKYWFAEDGIFYHATSEAKIKKLAKQQGRVWVILNCDNGLFINGSDRISYRPRN